MLATRRKLHHHHNGASCNDSTDGIIWWRICLRITCREAVELKAKSKIYAFWVSKIVWVQVPVQPLQVDPDSGVTGIQKGDNS